MTNLQTYLDEVKAREAKATPGPWVRWDEHAEIFAGEVKENTPFCIRQAKDAPGKIAEFEEGDEDWVELPSEDNAEFSAHARTDIPKLLAIIEVFQKYASTNAYSPHVYADMHAAIEALLSEEKR